jgi:hypothetical protein
MPNVIPQFQGRQMQYIALSFLIIVSTIASDIHAYRHTHTGFAGQIYGSARLFSFWLYILPAPGYNFVIIRGYMSFYECKFRLIQLGF